MHAADACWLSPNTIKSMHVCVGVSDNRLQNVVITLDKVKLCLERPGQPPALTSSPLTLMLWNTCSQSLHTVFDRLLDNTGLLMKHQCSVTTAA